MHKSCTERVRRFDAMAMPVGVTYKGKKEFNTFFGGCVTLVLGIYVGALFVSLFVRVLRDPTYSDNIIEEYSNVEAMDGFVIDATKTTLAVRLNQTILDQTSSSTWVDQVARIQFYSVHRDN